MPYTELLTGSVKFHQVLPWAGSHDRRLSAWGFTIQRRPNAFFASPWWRYIPSHGVWPDGSVSPLSKCDASTILLTLVLGHMLTVRKSAFGLSVGDRVEGRRDRARLGAETARDIWV